MAKPRDNSVKLMIGIVVGTIVALAVGVTLYQINNQVGMRAKAADPCEAYTKQGPATDPGTVQSLDVDRFTMAQDSGLSKIVVVCAGAKFTKQFGGSYTYADLKVGDKVSVAGFYGDATKTTVLAKLVRDTSVSKAPEMKANTKERAKAKVKARITPPATTPSASTCVEGFDCTQCNTYKDGPADTGGDVNQEGSNAYIVANCYRSDNNGAACCSCLNNGHCEGAWSCTPSGYDARCTQSR